LKQTAHHTTPYHSPVEGNTLVVAPTIGLIHLHKVAHKFKVCIHEYIPVVISILQNNDWTGL